MLSHLDFFSSFFFSLLLFLKIFLRFFINRHNNHSLWFFDFWSMSSLLGIWGASISFSIFDVYLLNFRHAITLCDRSIVRLVKVWSTGHTLYVSYTASSSLRQIFCLFLRRVFYDYFIISFFAYFGNLFHKPTLNLLDSQFFLKPSFFLFLFSSNGIKILFSLLVLLLNCLKKSSISWSIILFEHVHFLLFLFNGQFIYNVLCFHLYL